MAAIPAWPSVLRRVLDVAQCPDGRHRDFRRSVNTADRCALEIACGPADQRRRDGRAAADEHLEIRQPRPGLLGGGQQANEKRSGSGHMRAALAGHQRYRHVRIPTFHQNSRGAQQQRALEGIDGAADVGDRGRDQEHVALVDPPVHADLQDQCMDRIVRVQNALRSACGARRVEDHADAVGVQHRQARRAGSGEQRRIRRVASRVASQHHYLGR